MEALRNSRSKRPSARRLPVPGADMDGVRYLRTLADSDQLVADLSAGGRTVLVVGAGWIGLEVAAAARQHGNAVTVVEPQPTPLHAVLGAEMGKVFARLHRDRGVDLFTDTTVREFRGTGGRVESVVTDGQMRLKQGTRVRERAAAGEKQPQATPVAEGARS